MNEFDFIRHYLQKQLHDPSIVLGIGDDAAVVRPEQGKDLHISKDMLLVNRHFFDDMPPEDLAHKILAVNVSDMAAMGATPKWVLLGAALPQLDSAWLERFCQSLFHTAQQFGVSLIGGDTTRGELAFSVTIMGETPQGLGLRRSGAKVGDDIWVSGQIGLAAVGLQLQLLQKKLPEKRGFSELTALSAHSQQACLQALARPEPRLALGQALLKIAHAAQDISDGLVQDLEHILRASNVGAELWEHAIPTLPELQQVLTPQQWRQCVLAGGDDYELLFTAAPQHRDDIRLLAQNCGTRVSRIGQITQQDLKIVNQHGQTLELNQKGFDHFAH